MNRKVKVASRKANTNSVVHFTNLKSIINETEMQNTVIKKNQSRGERLIIIIIIDKYLQKIANVARTQQKTRYQYDGIERNDPIVEEKFEIVTKYVARLVEEWQHQQHKQADQLQIRSHHV